MPRVAASGTGIGMGIFAGLMQFPLLDILSKKLYRSREKVRAGKRKNVVFLIYGL